MRTRRDNERIPVVHTREKGKRKRNENTTVVPYVEREDQLEVYQTISESSALWLNANRGSILNNRRRSASWRRLRRRAPTMSRDVHWLSSPKIHSRLLPANATEFWLLKPIRSYLRLTRATLYVHPRCFVTITYFDFHRIRHLAIATKHSRFTI